MNSKPRGGTALFNMLLGFKPPEIKLPEQELVITRLADRTGGDGTALETVVKARDSSYTVRWNEAEHRKGFEYLVNWQTYACLVLPEGMTDGGLFAYISLPMRGKKWRRMPVPKEIMAIIFWRASMSLFNPEINWLWGDILGGDLSRQVQRDGLYTDFWSETFRDFNAAQRWVRYTAGIRASKLEQLMDVGDWDIGRFVESAAANQRVLYKHHARRTTNG